MKNTSILLTIDVEDWFQVENFRQCIPFSSWPYCELRFEKNVHLLLDLFDSLHINPTNPSNPTNSTNPTNPSNPSNPTNPINPINPSNPKATFFILGWIAERLPHLVREINARGHEVASHGYCHDLCDHQSSATLKKDLSDSKRLLEDIIGAPVYGYRAPSFSINHDILKIIEDSAYVYDSSYNSFAMHGRYGRLNLSQNERKGIATQIADTRSPILDLGSQVLYELPISNLRLGNCILPWGGGAYFRLIPSPIFIPGVKAILRKQNAYLLYLHPWEFDPEQPKVNEAPTFFKFRHYVNLDKTASKLSSLIETFKECSFVTCHQYLENWIIHREMVSAPTGN
jgi:polysaccharide deacetylase family protein (PEP-CTERM system associated)